MQSSVKIRNIAVSRDRARILVRWLFRAIRQRSPLCGQYFSEYIDGALVRLVGLVHKAQRFAIVSKLIAIGRIVTRLGCGVYAFVFAKVETFTETASPGQKKTVAAFGTLLTQGLFVAILVFSLHSHFFPHPNEIVMTMGGPIGTQSAAPQLPKFMTPKVPTVLSPVIEPSMLSDENGSGPQGSPNATTPAEALAAEHAFPAMPVAYKAGGTRLVRLTLSIAADGAVADAKVLQSCGIGELDDFAIGWVRSHWRYSPAIQNGVAIAVTTTAVVVFFAT